MYDVIETCLKKKAKVIEKKNSRKKKIFKKPCRFIKSMSIAKLSKSTPLHEKTKNVSQDIVKVSYHNFFEGHTVTVVTVLESGPLIVYFCGLKTLYTSWVLD